MTDTMTAAEYNALTQKKPGKYRNTPTTVDGIRFDSALEANFYSTLKLLQKAGEVVGFCRQPRFIVTISEEGNTEYRPDFIVWYADGHTEIVDTKGFSNTNFILKQKAFAEKYPQLKLIIVRGAKR